MRLTSCAAIFLLGLLVTWLGQAQGAASRAHSLDYFGSGTAQYRDCVRAPDGEDCKTAKQKDTECRESYRSTPCPEGVNFPCMVGNDGCFPAIVGGVQLCVFDWSETCVYWQNTCGEYQEGTCQLTKEWYEPLGVWLCHPSACAGGVPQACIIKQCGY